MENPCPYLPNHDDNKLSQAANSEYEKRFPTSGNVVWRERKPAEGHRGSRAGLSTARHQGTKACLGNWYLIYPNARDKMWLSHIVCVSNPAQRKQAGACAGENEVDLELELLIHFSTVRHLVGSYQSPLPCVCVLWLSYSIESTVWPEYCNNNYLLFKGWMFLSFLTLYLYVGRSAWVQAPMGVRGVGSPGAGVSGCCALPNVGTGSQTQALCKRSKPRPWLLSHFLSLENHYFCFYWSNTVLLFFIVFKLN